MKLDKRSESSKLFRKWSKRFLWIFLIIILIVSILYYLVESEVISLSITDEMKEGSFGWFFRLVEEVGLLPAIAVAIIVPATLFLSIDEVEKKKRRRL